MNHLLTIDQAAEKLQVKPRTVRKWLQKGKLKGVKVGRLWRIREADLEKFVSNEGSDQ